MLVQPVTVRDSKIRFTFVLSFFYVGVGGLEFKKMFNKINEYLYILYIVNLHVDGVQLTCMYKFGFSH